MNSLFKAVFPTKKPIIAMLHIFSGSLTQQIAVALKDASVLGRWVDGLLIENYGWGYKDSNTATEEVGQILALIAQSVVNQTSVPVGINVLPNDYEKAFRIAQATGCQFIQMDHITGLFRNCQPVDPADFLKSKARYSDIVVFGGIHPKYYQSLDSDTPIQESAHTASKLADVVVVTGYETGGETDISDLRATRAAVAHHPVCIGSGLTAKNARTQLTLADAAIVGTALKKRGVVPGEQIDENLLQELMEEVLSLR